MGNLDKPTVITMKDVLNDIVTIDLADKSSALGRGGEGYVFKGTLTRNINSGKRKDAQPHNELAFEPKDVSVKFFRITDPMDLFDKKMGTQTRLSNELFTSRLKELKYIRALSHFCIQNFLSHGKLNLSANHSLRNPLNLTNSPIKELYFAVYEYIDGPVLCDLLEGKHEFSGITRDDLLSYLDDIVHAMDHLHRLDIMHFDINSKNIVVDIRNNKAILVDFSLCKCLPCRDDELTTVVLTESMPAKLREIIKKAFPLEGGSHAESICARRNDYREIVFPWLDLYHFGMLLKEMASSDYLTGRSMLSSFDVDYMNRLGSELAPKPDKITDIDQVRMHYKGMSCEFILEKLKTLKHRGTRFLSLGSLEALPPRRIIRNKGLVVTRSDIYSLINHPVMWRLGEMNQLSLLTNVFTSASQTRYDHLLSTLQCIQRVLPYLIEDPTFCYVMNDKAIARLEAVAVLHDINHFPFLHYFQETGVVDITQQSVARHYLNLKIDYEGETVSIVDLLERMDIGLNAENLIAILFGGKPADDLCPQDQIISSIINGPIDIDKCAYLVDDADFSGLSFGKSIDIHGLFDNVKVAKCEKKMRLIFSWNSRAAIEDMCISRMHCFERLYWQHTNRAMETMIIHVLHRIFTDSYRPNNDRNSSVEEPSESNDVTSPLFRHYLDRTLFAGEAEAIKVLTEMHEKKFPGEKCIIAGLHENRNLTYKLINEYTFDTRAHKSELLFGLCNDKLGVSTRKMVIQKLSDELTKYLAEKKHQIHIDEGEVIIDIPNRPISLGGDIPVYLDEKRIINLATVEYSPVLKAAEDSFAIMQRTIRVYISPRIRNSIGKAFFVKNNAELAEKFRKSIWESSDPQEIS